MVTISMGIDDYSISGHWCLLIVIILMIIGGYLFGEY
jgi:hypothetical protein